MLEYKIRQSGDVTIVDLKGPITLSEALAHASEEKPLGPRPVVVGEIIRKLLREGHLKILLNLKDVTRIDSSGIGELVGAFTSVQASGGELKLVNPVAGMAKVLQISRLDHLFHVETNETAAVQSFRKTS